MAAASAVRSTGRTAGDVVGQVSPEAGAAVAGTSDAVATELEATAEHLPR